MPNLYYRENTKRMKNKSQDGCISYTLRTVEQEPIFVPRRLALRVVEIVFMKI